MAQAETTSGSAIANAFIVFLIGPSPLAFLSPEVIAAALKGDLRAEVDVAALLATGAVAACWREQARSLLPASAARQVAGARRAL